MSDLTPVGLHALVDVFEADDVVLAQVAAGLHLDQVQSGSYLGEDDIVRFEDVYQRV